MPEHSLCFVMMHRSILDTSKVWGFLFDSWLRYGVNSRGIGHFRGNFFFLKPLSQIHCMKVTVMLISVMHFLNEHKSDFLFYVIVAISASKVDLFKQLSVGTWDIFLNRTLFRIPRAALSLDERLPLFTSGVTAVYSVSDHTIIHALLYMNS